MDNNEGVFIVETVELFRFRIYDGANDQMKLSGRWGTRQAIELIGGVAVEETRVEIVAPEWDQLDGLTNIGFDPNRRKTNFQTQVTV